MFIGADNRRSDLRPLEQFDMALRHEIRVDLGADFAGAVRVLLRKPDPLYRRMPCRYFAAEQSDATAADNREAHALGRFPHVASRPLIDLLPRGSSA